MSSAPIVYLIRSAALVRTTPGMLFVPSPRATGNPLVCATMELQPQHRFGGKKQAGVTRFEAGDYRLRLWSADAKFAAKHPKNCIHAPGSRYARKLTGKFRGVVEICVGREKDGDKWTSVLFHAGNTSKHTQGCVLLGEAFRPKDEFLMSSNAALGRVYPALVTAALRGGKLRVVNANLKHGGKVRKGAKKR